MRTAVRKGNAGPPGNFKTSKWKRLESAVDGCLGKGFSPSKREKGREGGDRAKVKGEEDERERRGEIGKIVEV